MARILLTGATGYIGGRLAPRLIAEGHEVRCLARDPERLTGRAWGRYEVVSGDLGDGESLREALRGCEAAYYLVHSMREGERGFEERDRRFASNFAKAARESGAVRRIIYLGGLGEDDGPGTGKQRKAGGDTDYSGKELSRHLQSRHEVGDRLRESGIPVTEFRAAVVVGSGSASFEMIRYLVERLPVMITPRWVWTRCQPIAIRDVLRYLVEALERPESAGRVLEIGGGDVVTYGEMMLVYAEVRGLRRWMVPVPVLTPRLSSLWVNLVTPLPASLARPLIEGLRSEVVVRDPGAREIFPFEPMGYREAVRLALDRLRQDDVETSWFDAASNEGVAHTGNHLFAQTEGMIVERRTAVARAGVEGTFQEIAELGGERGWLFWDVLWDVRGWMDRIAGGPGIRRGRRSPTELRRGDAVDFWRVEAYDPPRRLRLRAEMKLPGRAWLQFEVEPVSREEGTEGRECRIVQTAFFEPWGLHGNLYWYACWPAHAFIFPGLVHRLARRAEERGRGVGQPAAK